MSSYEDALQEITSKKNVDLNLPNFTSTKYNKTYWRIIHFWIFINFIWSNIININFSI